MGRRLKGTGAARKAALEQASLRDRARQAAAGEGAALRGGDGDGGGGGNGDGGGGGDGSGGGGGSWRRRAHGGRVWV